MSQTIIHLRPGLSTPAPPPDASIYTGPDDVVGDPNLTADDKRAVLASWVSDAKAIEDAPTLRRLDSGAVVEVGAILEALRRLDQLGAVVLPLPTRGGRPPDDDDPPPTPARSGLPPRPIRVDVIRPSNSGVPSAARA
jgi:hypothetical protein